MRISSLKLKDFRPFHKTESIETVSSNGKKIIIDNPIDIEVKFSDSNLTVFIGENGSGKTTILDALGILLTKLFIGGTKANQYPIFSEQEAKILHGDNSIFLEDDDIYTSKTVGKTKYDAGFTSLELKFKYEQKDYKWLLKGIRDEKENFSEQLEIELPDEDIKNGYDNLDNLVAKLKNQISNPFFDLPMIAYYQTNRIVLDKLEQKQNESVYPNAPQLLAYENAITRNLLDFQSFSDWFKLREDNEMEIRLGEGGLEYTDNQLNVVRTALYNFSKELEFPFSNLKVVRSVNKKRLYGSGTYSLVLDKNHSSEIKVKKLSAGEKSILVLVADIAHRIAIANPGLLEQGVEYTLQNATGIIIIDEIDLHLHPKWQRLVVPALMTTFPNVQFIMTTHSDEVLKTIPAKCIRKGLFFQEIPKYAQGHSTHYIRSELQEVDIRTPEVVEYLDLIEKEKLDSKRASELKKFIDKLDPNSDERMRINFAIKRKEALKK